MGVCSVQSMVFFFLMTCPLVIHPPCKLKSKLVVLITNTFIVYDAHSKFSHNLGWIVTYYTTNLIPYVDMGIDIAD